MFLCAIQIIVNGVKKLSVLGVFLNYILPSHIAGPPLLQQLRMKIGTIVSWQMIVITHLKIMEKRDSMDYIPERSLTQNQNEGFSTLVMQELLSKENYPIILHADLSIFIYMESLRMLLNVSNKSIKHCINYFCLCSYTNTKSKMIHIK